MRTLERPSTPDTTQTTAAERWYDRGTTEPFYRYLGHLVRGLSELPQDELEERRRRHPLARGTDDNGGDRGSEASCRTPGESRCLRPPGRGASAGQARQRQVPAATARTRGTSRFRRGRATREPLVTCV